jgi:hypothetical protein
MINFHFASAQAWAEHVSQTGIMTHASYAQMGGIFGESIAGFYWEQGPTAQGGNVCMDRRKVELCPRHPDRGDSRIAGQGLRSLHADGLAQHTRGRVWGRAPWFWWSSLQHSGVPLQPAGQLRGGNTVLEEEPQAPGYVVHKIAVWRPTVSMTISGVPLFPRGQLGRAVSVWPRCCSSSRS